eukprot:gene23690-biopygen2853
MVRKQKSGGVHHPQQSRDPTSWGATRAPYPILMRCQWAWEQLFCFAAKLSFLVSRWLRPAGLWRLQYGPPVHVLFLNGETYVTSRRVRTPRQGRSIETTTHLPPEKVNVLLDDRSLRRGAPQKRMIHQMQRRSDGNVAQRRPEICDFLLQPMCSSCYGCIPEHGFIFPPGSCAPVTAAPRESVTAKYGTERATYCRKCIRIAPRSHSSVRRL